MGVRSPTRFLAPLALIAVAAAIVLVVTNTRSDSGSGDNPAQESTTTTAKRAKKAKRTYRVRAGDNLSSIAQRTDIPLERLQQLNPDVDPQGLTPGERIRLRP